jgi:hypothetical protein
LTDNPRTRDLLRHLATRPGHDEVKSDFRQLLVEEFGVALGALDFERRVPEVRGRLDALIGRTVFEAKRNLDLEWDDVVRRMPDYLADREREEGERFVGIASDGLKWVVFERSGEELIKLKDTTLDPDKAEIFLAWLDGAVALKDSLSPDPITVRLELGQDSVAFRRANDGLRALFREAAMKEKIEAEDPHPDPPPFRGREQKEADPHPARDACHPPPQAGEGKEESLTGRARALYEDTNVPVREIARLCGVTEHTIYKYARRNDWKPRYHWVAGEAGVRHCRWRAPAKFAPAKGAGARYIRREDAGEKFPVGLKATDPAAAAHAAAECAQAEAMAEEAQARAARERQAEVEISALAAVGAALAEISARRRAREKAAEREWRARVRRDRKRYAGQIVVRNGMPVVWRAQYDVPRAEIDPRDDAVEDAMWVAVAVALSGWGAQLSRVPARGAST